MLQACGAIEGTIDYAKSLIIKEKEQIIDAHTNAYLIGEDDISVEDANEASIKYYNLTYNQNKQPMNKEFIPYDQILELKALGFDGILWQQAFRWFRENQGLFTRVDFINSRYDDLPPYYDYIIGDMNHCVVLNVINEEFATYEEAELACLKKLIEIVKNK
jgi:hypothetical protein